MRGTLAGMALILAALHVPGQAFALDVSRRYRSPRNPERKARASTELIVLHTTEAPARSSLNKLSERGEAHYCVTEEGRIYAIVDRDREAFHAGRSMWRGREDVDKFSIGIECVGYHNQPMPSVQLRAVRDLVKELQRLYRIPDACVVSHSHVAYGLPNKWQPRRHRGRKRCGMLFAMPSVRRILELKSRPAADADTRSGRLIVGDPYLQQVLYGKTDTMVGKCRAGGETPASGGWFKSLFGSGAADRKPPSPQPSVTAKTPTKAPARTAVRAAVPGKAAAASGKPAAASGKAAAAKGSPPKSVAQLQAMGYVRKGTVTPNNSASRIAGKRWNAADTYYVIRDKVVPGNTLDASRIEKGMCVWMKK
ncbi:MAG: N-acetylmuramoyl-L-alanine amidase [Kiritimatiellia bacterium]